MREIKITGVNIEEVRKKVTDAFAEADISNAKIYFHITRGSQVRGHLPGEGIEPNFFLTVSELPFEKPENPAGIAVISHPDWRWKRCDIKSLNLLANVMARIYAHENGFDEAILLNDEGMITEGAGSSVFFIKDGTLITRPLGKEILPSITRRFVLDIAEEMGIGTAEKSLTLTEALQSSEIFTAVTTKDIVPVINFDREEISSGKPGPQTLKIKQAFRQKIAGQE